MSDTNSTKRPPWRPAFRQHPTQKVVVRCTAAELCAIHQLDSRERAEVLLRAAADLLKPSAEARTEGEAK